MAGDEKNGSRMDRIERVLEQSNARMDRFDRGLQHLLETQAKNAAAAEVRFEKIERNQQELQSDFSQLLKAQVLLVDAQLKTNEKLDALVESQRKTDEKLRETGEKLDALIRVVDDIVRGRPSA